MDLFQFFLLMAKKKLRYPKNQKIKVFSVKRNGLISIFSVNGKEKIALCAYKKNSKVSHFEVVGLFFGL